MQDLLLLVTTFTSLLLSCRNSIADDTITRTKPLTHNQTLVSSDKSFELGFFSLDKSNWYLGIWYKKIPTRTVVWVANRNNPIQDSSGLLMIDENGTLVLTSSNPGDIWSSLDHSNIQNPIAQLMNSGNLVLKQEGRDESESYIWQSFDHPTDTLLAGMKLGWDLTKGLNRNLTSWKSSQDPSAGEFTTVMDPHGNPEFFVVKGSVKDARSGPWNGLRFSGLPEFESKNPVFSPIFVSNNKEVYYGFKPGNNHVISRGVMSPSGLLQRYMWSDQRLEWTLMLAMPQDRCDTFGLCGAYGACNINDAPICKCWNGFTPKSPQAWDQFDWSDGCERNVNLDCNAGDGFVKYMSVKLPYTSECLVNKTMTIEECRVECLKNCSCMAYSNSDIRGEGSGCVMWFGDLIDIKQFKDSGQDIYVRMAASEIAVNAASRKRKKSLLVTVLLFIVLGLSVLGSVICYFIRKAWMKHRGEEQKAMGTLDLPLFDFDTIANATNNFSSVNKLGEGGFGPVYKGILSTGQEIAAKRLSQTSGQGLDEFKNEVIFIAKLQHRNLVRLLGCCIQREEKMLIYEYMPNNSLESFLFGQERSVLLDWNKRYHIVVGIAQGLLYLHRDSRLTIIHRDLKASNVLLDGDMNPKISDFGMARNFKGDEIEADTIKVVGTHGYMSPEYAIGGRFSMKSDIFSFGVMVLEIVSGKKNRGFYHPDHDLNLLGHAWKLWNEGKALELMDPSMGDPQTSYEALRLIKVGLLCVQQRPEDRPDMSSVVLMLCSEGALLPEPHLPGFYYERFLNEEDSSSSGKKFCSQNGITVTIEGR